ncbi:DUF6705 family protein [Bacteroides stercorirosoris]|uniref:DUF6705 domain-containing protein n=1 Tax=Bacteroides stercorirosoris TaxID=871324 RepID=A0A413HAA5_9BACE|nr:DUF6705 family protein [Bacteroides stercorirosoris]RGX80622.1 hypothetical protein DXA68_03400 [Bacteroides stercorirosoris]
MNRINLILCLIMISTCVLAQKSKKERGTGNMDAYVGTWIYQSNDTIFKIILQKGQRISPAAIYNGLYGGYYLSVKGKVLEDYMGPLPTCWNREIFPTRPDNIYIWASNTDHYENSIIPPMSIIFYDKRKKHFDGKGITGGYIKLLSPKKLLWHLDEKEGLWWEVEGREDTDITKVPLIGFSIPDHAILTKEE